MMLFDLQFRDLGTFRGIPLTTNWFSWLTRGHCLQPVALHFCPLCSVMCFMLSCLFCTNMLPIELCFFTANMIRVFPFFLGVKHVDISWHFTAQILKEEILIIRFYSLEKHDYHVFSLSVKALLNIQIQIIYDKPK